MTIPDWISLFVTRYGYAALLLATLFEGPIATIIGAFLASQGLLDIALVYVIAVLGDLSGDVIHYGIGRSGWMIFRRRRDNGSTYRRRKMLALARRFKTNPGRVLLFGKFTHSAGFLILLTAGAIRIPMPVFLGYNLLGTLPKSAVLAVTGYFFGAAYSHIGSYLSGISLFLLAGICLSAGIWLRKYLASPVQVEGERSNG